MAEVAVERLSSKGTVPTYGAAAAGDTAKFGRNRVIHFRHTNSAGAAVTITVSSQVSGAPAGLAAQDVTINLPAGGEAFLDMAEAQGLVDASNKSLAIAYSATTDVERVVLEKIE